MKRATSLLGAVTLLRQVTPARRFVPLFGLILLTCTSSPGQSSGNQRYPSQITLSPFPAARPQTKTTVDDVIRLSKAGLSDDVIIQQIKKNGQRFDLSTDQLLRLKSASVSERVIQVMIELTKEPAPFPAGKVGSPAPQQTEQSGLHVPTTTEGKKLTTSSHTQEPSVPADTLGQNVKPVSPQPAAADSLSFSHTKPVILISGSGNVRINSNGQGVGGIHEGVGWAAGTRETTINQHDQTMEMAGDFSKFCPAVELTLSPAAQPDYFVFLNREGQPTVFGELGQSQIMVLNKRKSIIFEVGKKPTVKNAVKSACNAIAADWQANGLIAVNAPASVAPITPSNSALLAAPVTSQTALQATSVRAPQPKLGTVAIVMHTTAAAEKYCKPETIASILSDTNAYVLSKGLILGTAATSKTTLVLIVDRPVMKWIEITVQGRDGSGNVLWSETVSEGAWAASTHLGTKGMLKTLEKVHQVIEARLN